MHQRQYAYYIPDKGEYKDLYQYELLQSQLEIQNQTFLYIGEELHNNVGQLLALALIRLHILEDETDNPDTQCSIHQTCDILKTIITDIRLLTKNLGHADSQKLGLLSGLALELDRIHRGGRIETQLLTNGEPYALGDLQEIIVLRMAQELLNNTVRHAQARHMTASVDYQTNLFTLTITDDGRGFDPGDVMNQAHDKHTSGICDLHRRARLLGGICTVSSQAGGGTCVEIALPCPEKKEAE